MNRSGIGGAFVVAALVLFGAVRCGDGGGGSAGKPCGGFAGNTCGAAEYCAYEGTNLCGQADGSATCKLRPTSCPATVDTVCACDGTTYPSPCAAAKAGFGYIAKGACP